MSRPKLVENCLLSVAHHRFLRENFRNRKTLVQQAFVRAASRRSFLRIWDNEPVSRAHAMAVAEKLTLVAINNPWLCEREPLLNPELPKVVEI